MPEFSEALKEDISRFRNRVLTDPINVLDPEGVVHHEFASGNHGRKLDFDKIDTYSDFYTDWVITYARVIKSMYSDGLPDVVVGIARGANRLAKSIAPLLGEKVVGLTTKKIDAKTVELDEEARTHFWNYNVDFALAIEDVGTTGSTTSTLITELKELEVPRIESISFWQRNPSLPMLDEMDIPYGAVILEPMPMFSLEKCASEPDGYCNRGVPLIPHE